MLSQLQSLLVDQEQRPSLTPYDGSTSFTPQDNRAEWWRVWHQASQKRSHRSQLSLEKKSNFRGETWWQVTDPCSGKLFYAQTLNEAIHWIEVQRLG